VLSVPCCCVLPPPLCAANNWLNGTLPDSLRRLTRLQQLALGANFMSGRLPDWLGDLRELRELRLGANLGTGSAAGRKGFYGTIPESLGRLTELQVGCIVVGWQGICAVSCDCAAVDRMLTCPAAVTLAAVMLLLPLPCLHRCLTCRPTA
jgi:hypothetical protein